ncbi:hypothetical protein HZH66_006736 [Vespula vulgaris]|uniref:Uncharacterized protein n=1 Tax=Vespula vulgaris TaxID=7454 RepID=A0A834N8I7_VESVU|nr:hypothetical protein HZH66_006736 [Vespula vulgaris]
MTRLLGNVFISDVIIDDNENALALRLDPHRTMSIELVSIGHTMDIRRFEYPMGFGPHNPNTCILLVINAS